MKKKTDDSYEKLAASIKSGQIGSFYIFHGEERYLLEYSLAELRKRLCTGGLDGFNYKRFEGAEIQLNLNALDDAINTLPVFAERTLIEVHDFDIFKGSKKANDESDSSETSAPVKKAISDGNTDKQQLAEMFADLPDYVCVVFLFDTIPYKPDNRQKLDKEILKYAHVVEFSVQEQSKLTKWISRHFEAAGKKISKSDAEYIAFITDGHMTTLIGEIAKVSAYASGETVKRDDIDAVVMPVLNAFAYKLTDAILAHNHSTAMRILDELFQMREPSHKIIYNISLKMRQFLAARVCVENSLGKNALMDMCGIRFDFQASSLMATARKTTLSECRDAVLRCAEAAYDLNSAPESEARLTELVLRLAFGAS